MPASRWWLRWAVLATCLLMTNGGCAFVTPRFPQNIQASFARDEMRKLTTESLELYYPAHLRGAALRMASRLEGCVTRLREQTWRQKPRDRVLVYLTSSNFNNAYVVPDYASVPQQMVMPSHLTLELFHLFNLGEVDVGDVACHEAVHYVQLQQTDGVWGFLNLLTGGLFQPNSYTESWFLEGLATYYEGQFEKDAGRPHSPIWRGWFDSVVQVKDGRLNPGYLSPEHRALDPFGGNYMTGMHFVEYLAKTYGEPKLWKLVDEQGGSWVPPLAVTLRFKRVYGRDIGDLFQEYTQVLRRELSARQRPASQRTWVADAGYFSRLATHAGSGVSATVGVGRERYTRLTVLEPDGRVRFERPLVELVPLRRWVLGSPTLVSGMSFSRDGAWLYLVMADLNSEGGYTARLWKVDARDGEVVRLWDDVSGMGGSVTPDETGYVYVQVEGDSANVVRLNLETGAREPLTAFEASTSVGPPAVAPDGGRVVFPMSGGSGWDLVLREVDGSLRWLTRDGHFNYSPRWLDDDRLVFLRQYQGRLQAHLLTVSTREVVRITDAPHLVMDVQPVGTEEVLFLNREGLDFSIDRAPIVAIAAEERAGATASVEGPVPPLATVGAALSEPDAQPHPASGDAATAMVAGDATAQPDTAPGLTSTGTARAASSAASPADVPPSSVSPVAPDEAFVAFPNAPSGTTGMAPTTVAPMSQTQRSPSGESSPSPTAPPSVGTRPTQPADAAGAASSVPQGIDAPTQHASTQDAAPPAGSDAATQPAGAADQAPTGSDAATQPPDDTDGPPDNADAPTALSGLDSPVVAPADPGAELVILSDEPYSPLERFFIPEFRLPYIFAAANPDNTDETYAMGGLALAGQDRLGRHAYSLLLTFDSRDDAPSVTLAYGNATLAPWYIQVSGARFRQSDRTDLQATAFASRTFWSTPVTFGVLALNRKFDATDRFPELETRIIGPEISASYFAGDATSYGGTQRGLGITGAAGVYPRAFLRDATIGDLRLGLDGFFGGLPFTGRDNFRLSAVGRFLPGATSGLLQVGGLTAGQVWYSNRANQQTEPLPLLLQPGIAFSEYLRGYEDLQIRARNALIGSASYQYRVPIDYGWASTLWLFPSLFVRDIGFDAFGAIARTDNRANYAAAGGSASLRLTFGQSVPVSLYYQYAYRFERGLDHLHLFGLGL
ncbi:hypothetical protein [Comamonas sp. JC664]|uniref:hypothetical protein n=1 Tax=Comamonas sp. JC664 TaxID=2801917 RepID=UPI00192026B5|nr:hypothetical protein [Comamonas sp. JC664]MBL0694131.1 hypothetical protein [Comamonas sp. JC664]GHG75959.1 hypothetical protein GCM10012319_24610 [Comamonas sp. KCTC 72670]